ncbi:MAG: hypothetical protein AABY89_05465, partial [Acidobacteriota bacterium]
TLYKIGDPFLLFHFRFVQPNKSQLEVGRLRAVAANVRCLRAWARVPPGSRIDEWPSTLFPAVDA